MEKKYKKITPYTPYWEELANQLARDYVPSIYPCKKCGFPVISGYCCTFCNSSMPEYTDEEEKEMDKKYDR